LGREEGVRGRREKESCRNSGGLPEVGEKRGEENDEVGRGETTRKGGEESGGGGLGRKRGEGKWSCLLNGRKIHESNS